MFLVVAVDRNWAIGKDGKLVYRIPADRAQFRELTKGKTIIYGRKTLASFPESQPLAERTNIILTRDTSFACDGATIIHSIEELESYSTNQLYVIGGAEVYRQLYQKCKYAFVTYIDSVTLDCDAFFPNLDEDPAWIELGRTSRMYYQGLPYQFVTYINQAVD
jgi:dihydrofolate reductase